jgi:uncharacterized protein
MILFLDSSALVLLYTPTPDSQSVKDLVIKADLIVVATLALPETARVFYRMAEIGEITHQIANQHYKNLLEDWLNLSRITLDDALCKEASLLTQTFGIKGADSVQLATALYIGRQKSGVQFLSFDQQLNSIAVKAGIKLAMA